MAVFRFKTKEEEVKIEQTPVMEAKEVKKPATKKVANKSPKSSVPERDAIHAKEPKAVKVTKAKESKK